MIRPRLLALIVPALFLAAPLPVLAQQKKPVPAPSKPATPRAPIGVNGFISFASMRPSASDSFSAAGLESSATEIGGGGQVTNLWRGVFVQGNVSSWDGTGERAFIDNVGNRFPLGIPLDVSMTYVDFTAGWKFTLGRRGFAQRVRPYVGGGVGFANYSESSPFAESGDDVDERFTSTHFLGGVEVSLHRWIAVAADVKFRSIPDAFGNDGIAAALRDDNLGGTSSGVRFIVGR
jgi:hypothetical protein